MNNKAKKILIWIIAFFVAVFLFEVYLPESFISKEVFFYNAKKGSGYDDIAKDLEEKGIIKSSLFFKIYVLISLNYLKLQAGNYELSPKMSMADIVDKFVSGDIVKNKITIIEGWDIKDLAKNFEDKKVYSQKEFLDAIKIDQSTCKASARPSTQDIECSGFTFLTEVPKGLSLEGYIFPDTYYFSQDATPEQFLRITLSNFDRKLTPDLKRDIAKQNKSIFQIITMASMLEKEVKSLEDKKIVSGILWKRIKEGIPLQVDATVNYITGKNDEKVKTEDTKIDSPYNTYKYYGLPLGPISNPGMDSILAAIYPEKTDYWYYLSADGTGKTIFSKTLEEHNIGVSKYLK